jgi:aspartate carbamoyltransferase catalytic subunit
MPPVCLTAIRGLPSTEIRNLLGLASKIKSSPEEFASILRGKTVLQFFVENSTRTRLSFETAVRRLGGTNLSFSASGSSVEKGETLLDTVQVIRQYGVHGIVMRHRSSRAPDAVARATGLPVINAGDGGHEHPTQALLDAFTLAEAWGIAPDRLARPAEDKLFSGKSVMILGDTLHSRVTRSNIHLLTALGAEVILCGPSTLTISNLGLFPEVRHEPFPEASLGRVDAVIALRLQLERQSKGAIPSLTEYRHFWGLTAERAASMKPGAWILHPGPMNRGVEIDSEVADSPRSKVLNQVENGVFVRMAVLATLVGGWKGAAS